MLAEGFLAAVPGADRDDVREALSANLCRCTGYQTIVDAVAEVAASRRAATGTPSATPTATEAPTPKEPPQ